MKRYLLTLLLSSPLFVAAADYNFSGDFGAQFTRVINQSKFFGQKAGRAIYHNSDVSGPDNTEGFSWNGIQPRADQSWTFSADVTIPLLAERTVTVAGEDPEIYAEIGIGCVFGSSDGPNFGAGLQQGHQGDSHQRIVISETYNNEGEELFDPYPDVNGIGELATTAETIRVTITYNAATHTLSTLVGNRVLFSVDIEDADAASGSSNQTDWGMAANDVFTLFIFGTSENYPVAANRPLQIDNLSFSLVDGASSPLSLTISQRALELNLTGSESGVPVEIQTSEDLTNWFTIQTKLESGKSYVPADDKSVFFRAISTSP